MAVDLTQYQAGDDILGTVRGTVVLNDFGDPDLRVNSPEGWADIPLSALVKAEHVAPEITPGAYYLDGPDLYVGMGGHRLFGPVGPASGGGRTRQPDEVALLRGLRRAEVRAAVPA